MTPHPPGRPDAASRRRPPRGWLTPGRVLIAIVVVFVKTMGARKLTESEGRILKLVSGFMMLGFGLMLLFAPLPAARILSWASLAALGGIAAAALGLAPGAALLRAWHLW